MRGWENIVTNPIQELLSLQKQLRTAMHGSHHRLVATTWSSHGDNLVSSHAPESSEKEVPESIYCMQLELQKRPRGSKIINIPGIPDHQVYYLTGNSRAQYVTLPSDPDQVQNSKKGWKGSLLIK
jgi:hypothetical protein